MSRSACQVIVVLHMGLTLKTNRRRYFGDVSARNISISE